MLQEYTKFLVNGGLLGLVAWGLQLFLFHLLGGETGFHYFFASALTYTPLLVINFMVQRAWIFHRPGLFPRFAVANLSIMVLVSVMSPLCRLAIDSVIGPPWGVRGGFVIASLIGSIPSFLIKRFWVFSKSGDG